MTHVVIKCKENCPIPDYQVTLTVPITGEGTVANWPIETAVAVSLVRNSQACLVSAIDAAVEMDRDCVWQLICDRYPDDYFEDMVAFTKRNAA